MIRSVSFVTAAALGIASGCTGDPVAERISPLKGGPAGFAAADKSRTSSKAMVWNPGVHDRRVTGSGPGTTRIASVPSSLAASRSALGIDAASTATALVLYDTTGQWGFLGEEYAIGAANLASHFGKWTAKPASQYTCGELTRYTAAIYLGSTFDEPLPTCLLDDILAGTRPVLWSFYNIGQLSGRSATFGTTYGWTPGDFDFSSIAEVDYKGHALERFAANGDGILVPVISNTAKVKVLALARRANGTTLPWAIRSGNLTYVGEIPFSYMSEEDRWLAYADLLFDALAPSTPERHRALLRLEDINPTYDAAQLQAIAEYLYSQHIPYGFGTIPQYTDPLGFYNDGVPEQSALHQTPDLVATLKYMASHGGTIVMHGYTHQWDTSKNPYSGVTADDDEFYRVTMNADQTLNYVGPVPEDSLAWAGGRMDSGLAEFRRSGVTVPQIFEFPHYAASVNAYHAIPTRFTSRWERALYFPGVLRGTAPDYSQLFGQLFPYAVRDVYGTRVLPEDLGNIEIEPFEGSPPRLPIDIINAGDKNLVVRDGVAGFFFHPFLDIQYLKDTIDGLRALGYTFVSPTSL
ncbi:MAG TPA: polysaccharide deacetylase family protein [Kofleriaceae bacterium]|nr:polysaccharide deacetylase family protein [Kofleriaceae bacterium]